MSEISLQIKGLPGLLENLDGAGKQLPFAISKALNETGKILQKTVTQKLLPQNFILAGVTRRARGAPWWRPGTALGFNLKFARKSQGDAMQTVLGSRADWLALQELGGTKRAEGGRVAVPLGIKTSPADIITRQKRPRTLIASRRAFAMRMRNGEEGIFRRTGKELKLLYLLEPSVAITPALQFGETTTKEAQELIGPIFEQEFHKAMTSAKR